MVKIFLGVFACFFLGCQGLQLTLNRELAASLDRRFVCGILQCVEESNAASNNTSNQIEGDGSSRFPVQVAEISSLEVFKLGPRLPSTGGTGKTWSLLATINSQHTRVSRVSDGVQVTGALSGERANLSLKLFKQDDCRAEFVCQSRAVDPEGRELVSTAYLMQQPETRGMEYDLRWTTPGGTSQVVLDLVQRLDYKVATMGSVFANWEERMVQMKESLEHSMDSIKDDLETKTYRLEDKLEKLENALTTHADRLEDKLESLHREAENRANRFEDKLESMKNRLEDKLNFAATNKPGDLVSCSNEVNQAIKNQITTGITSLGGEITAVKDGLAQLKTDIHKQLLTLGEQGNLVDVVKNLTRTYEGLRCESDRDLTTEFYQNLTSLQKNLKDNFSELSSNITTSKCFTDTQTSSEEALLYNLTAGGGFKSSMSELLTPKSCFKGMAFAASLVSSMYSVVQPSAANSSQVPVLCDTVTDGGGWIVIQRRVTGDVNFYRGWDDYKRGFGSLSGDFWLGNDNIHAITRQGAFELRVDLRYNDDSVFAHFDSFSLGNEERNFALHVKHYSGTSGDSLSSHKGLPFSTYDKDNDASSSNCAVQFVGAWWYGSCHSSNLNGQWGEKGNRGPRWSTFSAAEPVAYTEMKVRRVIDIV